MSNDAEKKQIERRVIEHARKHSTVFPTGDLSPFENPDWLIPSASLAIEVSLLLPEKKPGHAFSGPQLSRFQEDVVRRAERHYYSVLGGPPVDVLMYFNNDWYHKRNLGAMVEALATSVLHNCPTRERQTVNLSGPSVRKWDDGFGVIRITREKGAWRTGGCSDGVELTFGDLARRIAAKNQRLPEYRKRVPGSQIWLLFASVPSVLWSISTPRDVEEWRFASDFDRVLFFPWEYGCFDVTRTEN